MRSTLLLVFLFILAPSVWAGYKTIQTKDANGNITFSMQDNKLGLPKGDDGCRTDHFSNSVYFADTHVQLLVEKTVYPSDSKRPPEYRLKMDYQSDAWIFLKQITFSAGGEFFTFKFDDPQRSLDEVCHEWATVKVEPAFLENLAGSPFVFVHLLGRDQALDLCFNDTNRKNLNKFLGESQQP